MLLASNTLTDWFAEAQTAEAHRYQSIKTLRNTVGVNTVDGLFGLIIMVLHQSYTALKPLTVK